MDFKFHFVDEADAVIVAVETDAADKANKTDDACEAGAAKVNEADVAVKPDEADEAFDAKADEADELTSE